MAGRLAVFARICPACVAGASSAARIPHAGPDHAALAVVASLLLVAVGCSSRGGRDSTADDGRRKVAVQLNWYAEAEHGGVYQAKADGTYEAAGLDVEIRPGGRGTVVAAEVMLGRADFAITNADDVVLYRAEGSDIVTLMTAMQNHPRCILVRTDSGVTSLDELSGMTLQRQEGRGFVEFLRSTGRLDGVREVPYPGGVAGLVGDPKIAIQAYSIAEPFVARGEGVEVLPLMVSELGWNPYCSVLITRGELVRTQPELVREFVAATTRGWQSYVTDPALGNELILAANQHGMTAEALDFGVQELVKLAVPEPMTVEELGTMTAERWKTLVEQMEQLKMIKPGSVKPEECYTLEFLPTVSAEATAGAASEP